MSTFAAAAPAISGPSQERHAFLKRTAIWTLVGLMVAGVVGAFSTAFVAPLIFSAGRWGGTIVVLGAFVIAHWVCRKMVYGGAKVPGFALAVLAEGVALGCLLLTTVLMAGLDGALQIVIQALGLTAGTALGMLLYVWFSKGELKLVGAFLSMAFVPMLILMAVSIFFPFGGVIGLAVSALFVLVSAAGLLYRLHFVVHNLGTDQHVEGAYEITMGVLVLLWNIITLLNRFRR